MIGDLFAGLTWGHARLIHLMWVAAALVVVLGWLEWKTSDALSRFVSHVMLHRLASRQSRARRLARLGVVFASFVFGILALMRPQTPGGITGLSARAQSADIVVVLDVSRSMLADDAAPTRLARARAEISDLVGKLDGHRFGLVAFAGRAVVLSPLTPDQGFYRMALRGASPTSVSRGGTRIGDAIRKALEVLSESAAGSKMIILVTDGEDHDSFPRDAAKEAAAAGVRIISVGFGSEKGSQITIVDPETGVRSLVVDPATNQPVLSRLDGELLRDMSEATQGVYVPVGVSALDLQSIVDEHIEPLVRDAFETTDRIVMTEQYEWPLLLSLVFMLIAIAIGATGARRMAL